MYNELLKAFVCVADCGSFTKAAEKLYISPPSVMKQINALEKHLNLKLFQRTNQGIHLTPAGNVIYRHAKFLFTYSENAVREARAAEEAGETTFCIGSSLLNPCKPFMDLWYRLNQYFPGYKLHIVPFEDNHEGILSEIAALGKKFDFLIGVCDSRLWLNRCQFLKLGEYQHCIAVPREHRLAGKEKISLSDLEGETVMMVKKGDSAVVDSIRKELEAYPGILIEDTPQFYDLSVFNRCAENQKVMLTVECWKDVHPGLVTIPVEWDHPIPYGILYPLEKLEDVHRFIEVVKEHNKESAEN